MVSARDEEIEQIYLEREGKALSTFKMEIQQLKADNQRLLNMMRQKKEFKEFVDFVEDSGGAVRNVP